MWKISHSKDSKININIKGLDSSTTAKEYVPSRSMYLGKPQEERLNRLSLAVSNRFFMEERKFLKGWIKRNIYSRHAMLREYLLNKQLQGPQLDPLLPLYFRKLCLDMSDRLARKTWQKFICFRGWRTLQEKKKKKTWENKNSFQTGPRLSFTCSQSFPLDVCLDPMKTKRPQMKRGLPKTISYHFLWMEEPGTLVIQPKESSAELGRWLNP